MTEPPRPPGAGNPDDPTTPFNPYAANDPAPGSTPPPPPPGYEPPPAAGYGPPPAAGFQQYPTPPPAGYSVPGTTQDDRTWILIAHFGGAVGAFVGGGLAGWIIPLIAMLAKGNQSAIVRSESVKALNFQLLWAIVGVIGWATVCIGIGVVIVAIAWIVSIVFGVIAGIKAANGEPYNYPLSFPIVK